jgi:3-oxoadipate CoA-transferase alpha subunit
MATAATLTIAEVSRVVDVGAIDPETVVTPGIFVDRILDLSTVSGDRHTSEVAS